MLFWISIAMTIIVTFSESAIESVEEEKGSTAKEIPEETPVEKEYRRGRFEVFMINIKEFIEDYE